jgi:hypothetical protein
VKGASRGMLTFSLGNVISLSALLSVCREYVKTINVKQDIDIANVLWSAEDGGEGAGAGDEEEEEEPTKKYPWEGTDRDYKYEEVSLGFLMQNEIDD